MDPVARRETWEVIKEHKQNKVIILSTHYMHEADTVSDRIGILFHGNLKCSGSPFFLKQSFNVGYSLTITCKCSNFFDTTHDLVKGKILYFIHQKVSS